MPTTAVREVHAADLKGKSGAGKEDLAGCAGDVRSSDWVALNSFETQHGLGRTALTPSQPLDLSAAITFVPKKLP